MLERCDVVTQLLWISLHVIMTQCACVHTLASVHSNSPAHTLSHVLLISRLRRLPLSLIIFLQPNRLLNSSLQNTKHINTAITSDRWTCQPTLSHCRHWPIKACLIRHFHNFSDSFLIILSGFWAIIFWDWLRLASHFLFKFGAYRD